MILLLELDPRRTDRRNPVNSDLAEH